MSTAFAPSGTLQLGVFFQGVNSATVWRAPDAGSQTDFASFRHLAQTAERGLFAAFFLGEGLRLREHLGHIHDLDISGRPDAQTQLAAVAAVTTKIGLVATQNTTYTDPVELARRLQSLDLLSGGRAAWNVVTTDNAWTGENFRRGGFIDHADRYLVAGASLDIAGQIWNGIASEDIAASPAARAFLAARPEAFRHDAKYYSVAAAPTLPRSPQGRPVLFQAGDSPTGRDFAAARADVIFSRHAELEAAREFRDDIVARTARAGRPVGDVKIMPATDFVLAETDAEAADKVAWVRDQQNSPQQAIAYLEQFWGRDLSAYDPDGPLPDVEPDVEVSGETRGAGFRGVTREQVAGWRTEAAAKGQSIRQFVAERTVNRSTITGSYDTVAERLSAFAETGAVDGFNITPWLIPHGIDDVVNHLVPRLQERGIYPTEYRGSTLRENLGLPAL